MNDAGTAFIEVRADTSSVGKDISKGVDPHVDKSAKNVESKFGGAFRSVAKIAGGIFAVKLGADLFKDVIGGASDLNETISKSNTIFGDQGKAMEAWAGTAAKSMGQSKQGALDAAATFGNLFVQLGSGSQEAAKMSKEMVGLASDFASFHNADPTDVIQSMTAAFRGEYDAVQRYVPTINAATVEHKALEMGLAETTKELTAQDKALATQALLMSGAGAAIGDFARTSDGLANKQRILSAQWQDMKDKIGTALLPVVLQLMTGFMNLGKVIGPVAKEARVAIASLFSAFKGDGDVYESTGFAGAMEKIGIAARTVVEWFKANWPQIKSTMADFVAYVQANVLPLVQEVAQFFVQKFGEIVSWVKANWPAISEAITHVVNVVRGVFEALVPAIRTHWESIKSQIDIAIKAISVIIRTTLDIINGDWGRIWNGIKGTIGGVMQGIKEIIAGAFGWILDKMLGFAEGVVGLAARAFSWVPGLGPKLQQAKDWVASFRDDVNAYIDGIRGEITITADTSQFWAELGAARSAAQRGVAIETQSEGTSSAGPQKFHEGIHRGPVKGPKGADVPIIAKAGEWVLTDEQLTGLRSGQSGGAAVPVAAGVDAGTLQRLTAVLERLEAHPIRAEVSAYSLAHGLHSARPR